MIIILLIQKPHSRITKYFVVMQHSNFQETFGPLHCLPQKCSTETDHLKGRDVMILVFLKPFDLSDRISLEARLLGQKYETYCKDFLTAFRQIEWFE